MIGSPFSFHNEGIRNEVLCMATLKKNLPAAVTQEKELPEPQITDKELPEVKTKEKE